MIFVPIILAMSSVAPTEQAHELDPLMLHVTEGCLLPDISKSDPAEYFKQNGWQEQAVGLTKVISGQEITVTTRWPADKDNAASCSFYMDGWEPKDSNDWFVRRIGEANDTPWDADKGISIWRIKLNGHSAGIYVAKDAHPGTNKSVSVIHILQNQDWDK